MKSDLKDYSFLFSKGVNTPTVRKLKLISSGKSQVVGQLQEIHFV